MNVKEKAFAEQAEEVQELLKSVTTKIHNRCSENPINIHWGHIGDLNRIHKLLQEIDMFIL